MARGRKPAVELSFRHILVVDRYFQNDFDKGEAMRHAGYAESTSRMNSGAVFNQPVVIKEIARRKKEMVAQSEINEQWLVHQFRERAMAGHTLAKFKIIQSDGSLAWDFTGATRTELALVEDMGVEFARTGRGPNAIDVTKFKMKLPDAQAALTSLARHLGFFNDSIEVKGSLADRIKAAKEQAYQPALDRLAEEETVH